MNRKNLIGLMAALAAVAGSASAQETARESAPTEQAATAAGTARKVWAECVRAAVLRLDDSESPSDAVARLAMKSCSDQYTDMVRAVELTLAPSCGRDPDCTRGALATLEREATQAATKEVLAARVRVSNEAVLKCQ